MIRLYLDENVPEAVALGLRLRGFDVVTVNDTGHKGLSDFEQSVGKILGLLPKPSFSRV